MLPFSKQLFSGLFADQGVFFCHCGIWMESKHPGATQGIGRWNDGLKVLPFIFWDPGILETGNVVVLLEQP